MTCTFQASDEEYAYLQAYAEGIGETPETIFAYWVDGKIDRMEARRKCEQEQARKSGERESSDPSLQASEAGRREEWPHQKRRRIDEPHI